MSVQMLAVVAGNITIPVTLDGGPGNDKLKGAGGHDVLLGGQGDDLWVGGSRRDLLIGGLGSDRIVGNRDDDILIAGFTGPRLNGDFFLKTEGDNATVFDDEVRDLLTCSEGLDWILT